MVCRPVYGPAHCVHPVRGTNCRSLRAVHTVLSSLIPDSYAVWPVLHRKVPKSGIIRPIFINLGYDLVSSRDIRLHYGPRESGSPRNAREQSGNSAGTLQTVSAPVGFPLWANQSLTRIPVLTKVRINTVLRTFSKPYVYTLRMSSLGPI